MDIQSLRYFVAAAEYGSFTKAAEHLFTIQPTISKHVKRLEEELGVQLFIRGGSRARLTKAGEIVNIEAKGIVRKVDLLKDKINEYSRGELGQLKIGYNGDFNIDVLAHLTSSFCVRHPQVDVIFTKKHKALDLLHALYNDEFDIIITSGAFDLNDLEGLCCVEVASNRLVLVFSNEHRFKDYGVISKEDLGGEPMVLFPRYIAPVFYDWIIKSLVKPNKSPIIHEKGLANTFLRVASGKGVSLLSTLYLNAMPENIRAVDFAYDQDEINVDLMLFWKRACQNPSLPLLINSVSSLSDRSNRRNVV